MNIQDLKKGWNEQGDQSDLVVRLFKESRYEKIDASIRKNMLGTVLFTLLNLIINFYAWSTLISNFSHVSIRYAGLTVLVLTFVVIFKNMGQLNDIHTISDLTPIVKLQKTLARLKVKRIRHNRFIFVFSNLFFWSLTILVFEWDLTLLIPFLWQKAAIVVMIQIIFAVMWFPLSIWILNRYDTSIEASWLWKRLKRESHLSDESLNFSLNNALGHLKEIEAFENES